MFGESVYQNLGHERWYESIWNSPFARAFSTKPLKTSMLKPNWPLLAAVGPEEKPWLSREARLELECLKERPIPRLAFNPRVGRELTRTRVVDLIDLPRPIKLRGANLIKYLRINDAGREYLKSYEDAGLRYKAPTSRAIQLT